MNVFTDILSAIYSPPLPKILSQQKKKEKKTLKYSRGQIDNLIELLLDKTAQLVCYDCFTFIP